MKCEACGKEDTLDIRATLIRCSFCDGEWGRVNGFWVESKPPRCMDCGGDGKTVEAEPRTCPSCRGTGREGGVKGGVEPSSPLPGPDVPPSPCGKECDHGSPCRLSTGHAPADRHETEHGCVFFDPRRSVSGADAVCMPPVYAEPYRGVGRTGDCDCADDFTCAEHGGSHALRDHK